MSTETLERKVSREEQQSSLASRINGFLMHEARYDVGTFIGLLLSKACDLLGKFPPTLYAAGVVAVVGEHMSRSAPIPQGKQPISQSQESRFDDPVRSQPNPFCSPKP